MHVAAWFSSDSDSVVRVLLQAGSAIEARDYYKSTPLNYAAGSNSSSVVKVLIEAGADVNAPNKWQSSPLHEAARCNGSIIPLILEASANVNVLDEWNRSPLFLAANRDDKDGVIALIKAGADPNLGDSPLKDSNVTEEMKALITKLT